MRSLFVKLFSCFIFLSITSVAAPQLRDGFKSEVRMTDKGVSEMVTLKHYDFPSGIALPCAKSAVLQGSAVCEVPTSAYRVLSWLSLPLSLVHVQTEVVFSPMTGFTVTKQEVKESSPFATLFLVVAPLALFLSFGVSLSQKSLRPCADESRTGLQIFFIEFILITCLFSALLGFVFRGFDGVLVTVLVSTPLLFGFLVGSICSPGYHARNAFSYLIPGSCGAVISFLTAHSVYGNGWQGARVNEYLLLLVFAAFAAGLVFEVRLFRCKALQKKKLAQSAIAPVFVQSDFSIRP